MKSYFILAIAGALLIGAEIKASDKNKPRGGAQQAPPGRNFNGAPQGGAGQNKAKFVDRERVAQAGAAGNGKIRDPRDAMGKVKLPERGNKIDPNLKIPGNIFRDPAKPERKADIHAGLGKVHLDQGAKGRNGNGPKLDGNRQLLNPNFGGQDYHLSHGDKRSYGYCYRGQNHRHWDHRCWSTSHSCWYYYCPSTCCYYYWSQSECCFYPWYCWGANDQYRGSSCECGTCSCQCRCQCCCQRQ